MAERSEDRLVWLPYDAAELGDPPDSLRYELVTELGAELGDSASEVRFLVAPYQLDGGLAEVLPRLRSLEVLQLLTAGYDAVAGRIPEGVTLCNGRGIHDSSTAELALALTLASLRGLPGFVRAQDAGRWSPGWRPALADRHVVVVGAGAIGEAIRVRLEAFESTVSMVASRARGGVHGIGELPDLLPAADVVILVVPLTDATRGLVDADFLGRMRPGALLVNVARGAVVDTDALLAALSSGRITAAVDVVDPEPLPADHPLWQAPGLLLSPHVGGASSAMWPRAHRLVRDQLHRWAADEPLGNVVSGE